MLLAVLTVGGCKGTGSEGECAKDGDCPTNWVCDIYGKFCRCISDLGCNTALGERCMPSGSCEIYTGCKADTDCGGCQSCQVETGECLCVEDCGCPDGEKCNASGYCQPSSGCFDNEDCAQSEICDTPTKTCISSAICTHKLQCLIGQICVNGVCQIGCEDHGDCAWENGIKASCISGSCQPGVCSDSTFCGFLESCELGNCQNAYNEATAPYCMPCTSSIGNDCGDIATNLCLIYPFEGDAFGTQHDEYCGVDCSVTLTCPNGFQCGAIRVVDPADECSSDAQCPAGAPCLKSLEADKGYCACNDSTNRCPPDICGLITKTCISSKKPCQTSADCAIPCEKFPGETFGGCVMGRQCGLEEGIQCQL